MLQEAEVVEDTGTDEDEQDEQELALLDEVGAASFKNDLRNVQHGLVGRKPLDLGVHEVAVRHPQEADHETDHEQVVLGGRKRGNDQICLACEHGRRKEQNDERQKYSAEDTFDSLANHLSISSQLNWFKKNRNEPTIKAAVT